MNLQVSRQTNLQASQCNGLPMKHRLLKYTLDSVSSKDARVVISYYF